MINLWLNTYEIAHYVQFDICQLYLNKIVKTKKGANTHTYTHTQIHYSEYIKDLSLHTDYYALWLRVGPPELFGLGEKIQLLISHVAWGKLIILSESQVHCL